MLTEEQLNDAKMALIELQIEKSDLNQEIQEIDKKLYDIFIYLIENKS